jgi:hypothetical protein
MSATPTVEITLDDPSKNTNPVIYLSSKSGHSNASITSFHLESYYNTWKKSKVIIQPNNTSQWYDTYIAQKLINVYDTPTVWLRFGLMDGSSTTQMLQWERYLILTTKYYPIRTGGGAGDLVTLELVDQLYLMNRVSKTLCRKGTLNKIITAILQENNLDYKKAVIDGSSTTTTSWIQSNQTDFDFITKRLSSYFIGDKGTGGYRLYSYNNIIHFHPLTYSSPPVYQIDYPSIQNLTELEVSDDFYKLMIDGGGATEAVAVDPISGKSIAVKANPDVTPITQSSSNGQRPVLPDAVKIINCHTDLNDIAGIQGMVQEFLDERRSNYYAVKFKIVQSPLLQLGDAINLTFVSNTQASGNYIIIGVELLIDTTSSTGMSACIEARRGQYTTTSAGATNTLVYSPSAPVSLNNTISGQPIAPVPASVGSTVLGVNNPGTALT